MINYFLPGIVNIQMCIRDRSQIVARVLPSKCREAVKDLLQVVYGYEDIRNLEVYDDLFRGKEKLQVSQGQLIEEVIMEAEKGIKGDSSAHNLLSLIHILPSPNV